jgi:RNA polymerase sigma-70 factor (ECF subfamily)
LNSADSKGQRISAGSVTSNPNERTSHALEEGQNPSNPMLEPTDLEAVAKAAKGDHEAFRVLVERYQNRAYGLALRVMRDEEIARDVVQEAFLKAYRALDRFEGRSSFYTWFYRVVMNLCLDAKRRQPAGRQVEWDEQRAMQAPSATGMDAIDPDRQRAAGPSGELERAQLRDALRDAIDQLPDEARQTLVMREVDGLSYAEIAEALEIPKGTVMSRLHHARKRLRTLLEASGAVDTKPEPK